MTSLHARMFKLALAEKLAFTPPPQAPGPGGAPVGPGAGGPPPGAMDPMAGGPPPGDPAAGGAPPVDPAAAGAPPGPPPSDPAAGGAPPMDPAMMAQLAGAGAPPSSSDPQVPVSAMKDFAVSLIEAMKGKKTQEALAAEAKGEKPPEEPGAGGGPITGLPGLDAGALQGPLKMGSAQLAQSKTASILFKRAANPTATDIERSIRQGSGGSVTQPVNQMAASGGVPGAAKWNPRGVAGESDATILGNISKGIAHGYPRFAPELQREIQTNLKQHPPVNPAPPVKQAPVGKVAPRNPGDYQDPGLVGQIPSYNK